MTLKYGSGEARICKIKHMTIQAHYRENIIEAEKLKSGAKIMNAKKIFWKSNVDCVCKDFSKQKNPPEANKRLDHLKIRTSR